MKKLNRVQRIKERRRSDIPLDTVMYVNRLHIYMQGDKAVKRHKGPSNLQLKK